MSERRPNPPEPRASLVDSGWTEPPAEERELPAYEDTAREHLVTRVDDQIQARIAAMNQEERTQVSDVQLPTPLPPPPPPPPLPTPSRPPPPSRARHSRPPSSLPPPPPLPLPQVPPPPPPLPELRAAPVEEATVVDSQPSPSSSLPPPARPVSHAPPPPSFAPMPAAPPVPSFIPPPTLGEAMSDRVRVGSLELPLWGVLALVVAVTALFTGLLVAATRPRGERPAPPVPPASAAGPAAANPPSAPAPTSDTDANASHSGSLVDRARSGDAEAVSAIEHERPQDRSADEALALAAGKVEQQVSAVRQLRTRLSSDPGLASDSKVVADLRRMAQEPETSRDALAAMAALPGPLSADLLYDAWTSTAERSATTELAQALLLGKDVRPKASPALAVAIDLREAETCEQNAKVVERAVDVGDRRAFAPLTRLLRRTGCGPSKHDDCFPCLRDGDALHKALSAVKLRREPELVRRDGR